MKVILVTLLLIVTIESYAGSISKSHNFTQGTIISSSQINSNFDQLFTELNAKETRITALEGGGAGQWSVNGTSVYYNAGNVGVGTATPGQKLTVAGTVESTTGGVKFPDGSVQAVASIVSQVVSTTKTSVFNTAAAGWEDVTGLSLAITPKTITSKILLFVSMNGGVSTATTCFFRILRNGAATAVGDAAGVNRNQVTGANFYNYGDPNGMISASMNYLDSPATVAAITYQIQVKAPQGGGTCRINTSGSDVDQVYTGRSVSTITALEIAL